MNTRPLRFILDGPCSWVPAFAGMTAPSGSYACRLVKLLERPESIPALAPLIEREILYRLLAGPHGPMLRHMAAADSRLGQVSRAIARIRAATGSGCGSATWGPPRGC